MAMRRGPAFVPVLTLIITLLKEKHHRATQANDELKVSKRCLFVARRCLPQFPVIISISEPVMLHKNIIRLNFW